MTPARALLSAQAASSWNRLRHESGIAGQAATAALVGLVVVPTLLVPAVVMALVGARLAEAVARDGAAEARSLWNGVQGGFTVLFALLGAFRFQPAVSLAELGRYPLSRTDLALAEVPAAAWEVFPLLGLAGLLATNLGLAWNVPALAPLIALQALLEAVTMLSLMVLAASLWRLVRTSRAAVALLALALAAALAGASHHGWRATVHAAMPSAVTLFTSTPGAAGTAALVAFHQGRVLAGLLALATALAGTALLAGLAGLAHHRALEAGLWTTRRGPRTERLASPYRGPAPETGWLFFRQLAASRVLGTQLLLPLLLVGPAALVAGAAREAHAAGRPLPEPLATALRLPESAPLLAVGLFLCVTVNSQIWMNLFGWDRGTIRPLLLLPIPPRAVVNGKLLGLLLLTLLQAAICTAGVLLLRSPSAAEVVASIAAAGIAFVLTTAVGLFVSLQVPRAVPRGGMATTPLYLSWIPGVVTLSAAGLVAALWKLGGLAGPWGAAAALCAALGGAGAAWRGLLPQAERWLLAAREKLLAM